MIDTAFVAVVHYLAGNGVPREEVGVLRQSRVVAESDVLILLGSGRFDSDAYGTIEKRWVRS